jgi:hypothetical protein
VSIWVGVNALRNAQEDRLIKTRPKILFNLGAQVISMQCTKGKAIPGIDRAEARKALVDLDDNLELNIPNGPVSGPFNHGNGQAFNIEMWFVPETVTRGGEKFRIEQERISQFPYAKGWNTFPANPSRLQTGEQALFHRIPTVIVVDYQKTLQNVTGRMYLECKDGEGRIYNTVQPVTFFVEYGDKTNGRHLTISFGKEFSNTLQ